MFHFLCFVFFVLCFLFCVLCFDSKVNQKLKHCEFYQLTLKEKQRYPTVYPLLEREVVEQKDYVKRAIGDVYLVNFGSAQQAIWATSVVLKAGMKKYHGRNEKVPRFLLFSEGELFIVADVFESVSRKDIRVPNSVTIDTDLLDEDAGEGEEEDDGDNDGA